MGEAKRRQKTAPQIIYHHTSTLRTNLIWMAGAIELEGAGKDARHPQLGRIPAGAASLRRPMRDFPPVAWFTTRKDIPTCLRHVALRCVDMDTGKLNREATALMHEAAADITPEQAADFFALHRLALGFPVDCVPVIRWPEYRGYNTDEGRQLSDSAREFGDNPADWYVSETPVDVLKAIEVLISKTIQKPKLERADWYLKDIRRMVTLCQKHGAHIPPSWMTAEQASQRTLSANTNSLSAASQRTLSGSPHPPLVCCETPHRCEAPGFSRPYY